MNFILKLLLIFSIVSFNSNIVKASGKNEFNFVANISAYCTSYFTKAETKYGIPKHLLLAIANTESGRYNKALKRVMPWPWTLNIEGKGSYYNNIHDAITAVNRTKQQGKSSIDVGCMQVNLKHHPDAFNSVQTALTPANNIDYAARFLRSNFDEFGSWPKAIAAYHSRSKKGRKYFASVQKNWRSVRNIAGGNLLENTDYIAGNLGNYDEVKVSYLLNSNQNPKKLIKKPARFNLSVKDDYSNIVRTNNNTSQNHNIAKNIKVSMNQKTTTIPRNNGIRVIKVKDVITNDNAVVTVTPVSMKAKAENFVYDSQNINQIATNEIKPVKKNNPNIRKQPNFIFGR